VVIVARLLALTGEVTDDDRLSCSPSNDHYGDMSNER
jgi:hypothetical protein